MVMLQIIYFWKRENNNLPNIRTKEEIEKIINDFGYKLQNIYYKNNNTRKVTRVIFETIDGYKADISLSSLMKQNGEFYIVHLSNSFSLNNISLWLKINNKNFYLYENNEYKGTKKLLGFYCFDCENIFHSTWDRIHSGTNCTICSGQEVCYKTSLEYLRPELSKEFHIDNIIKPTKITEFSGKKVKWVCSICSHEWNARISDRSNGQGCPSCAGNKVSDKNRLSIIKPNIAKEWHPTKNGDLTPDDVSYGSDKKVWWLCSKCDKDYFSVINSRTIAGNSCSNCYNIHKESKLATELKEYILKNYKSQVEYNKVRNPKTNKYLPYDIYIYNNIYIEIHGLQHYKYVKYFHKNKEEFEYRKSLDKIKRAYAEDNGTYIEIDLRKIKTIEEAIKYVEEYLKN